MKNNPVDSSFAGSSIPEFRCFMLSFRRSLRRLRNLPVVTEEREISPRRSCCIERVNPRRNDNGLPALFAVLTLLLLFFSLPVHADDSELKEKTPQASEPYSIPLALTLDLIPGGGLFYTDSYISASIFASAKIIGIGSSWYLFDYWQEQRRNYRDAKRTRDALGLTDSDRFIGPDGKYRTVSSYKKSAARSAEYFTLSVIGNAALWTASWLLVWRNCEQHNFKSIPAFDISFDFRGAGSGHETFVQCEVTASF
jgi:hypothetical protein